MSNSDSRKPTTLRGRRGSVVVQVCVLLAVLVIAVQAGRRLQTSRATSPAPTQSPTQSIAPSSTTLPDDASLEPVAGATAGSTTLHASSAMPLYVTYCVNCHGADGHGEPDALLRLTPPPRDFAGNNWRFPKTAAEIRRVIREGIPGTAMPAMSRLFSETQLQSLSDHVLQLADRGVASVVQVPHDSAGVASAAAGLSATGFTVFATRPIAPKLHVVSSDGSAVRLTDFAGKLVLLNFWGTSCAHCLQEMPALAALREKFRDKGLVVLSVCADEDDPAVAAKTAEQFAPGHPVYCDQTGIGLQRYSVNSLPAFVLVGRDQKLIARRAGTVNWGEAQAQELITNLLLDAAAID
jgi:thiol-disulfide isomerase/thioredoxin